MLRKKIVTLCVNYDGEWNNNKNADEGNALKESPILAVYGFKKLWISRFTDSPVINRVLY